MLNKHVRSDATVLKDAFYQKIKYTIPLLLIGMLISLLNGCSDSNGEPKDNENEVRNDYSSVWVEYRNYIIVSADA